MPSKVFQLRNRELDGLNITIPYKNTVISYLDDLSDESREIGAVNTIVNKQDHLVGENTDASGFKEDLDAWDCFWDHPREQALVLGAGGAARAITYVLVKSGWRVYIASRRLVQADEMCRALGEFIEKSRLVPCALDEQFVQQTIGGISLIVNTTPSPWPSGLSMGDNKLVYDVIYNPPETRFLRNARQAGLVTRNGLGMLVRQAAAAFRIWTGFSCQPGQIMESISDQKVFQKGKG
jgi:shikimate dehydrogenase